MTHFSVTFDEADVAVVGLDLVGPVVAVDEGATEVEDAQGLQLVVPAPAKNLDFAYDENGKRTSAQNRHLAVKMHLAKKNKRARSIEDGLVKIGQSILSQHAKSQSAIFSPRFQGLFEF
jgi:hypothetical protein